MRCPDCNKFVGLETAEPEEQSTDVTNNGDGTATVTAEYTLDRNCAECSNVLKQGSFELETVVELAGKTAEGEEGPHAKHDLSVFDASAEGIEDSEPKPKEVRNRKTGKKEMKYPNPRYIRSLYGVSVTGTIRCDTCSEDVGEFEMSDLMAASSFEEQV